jgi:hemoglobin
MKPSWNKRWFGLAACTLVACAHRTASTQTPPSHTPPPAQASSSPSTPSPAAKGPAKSLFDRLGGKPALEAVVTEFMKNVAGDDRINAPFAISDLDQLHQHLVQFFCVATGGPCQYAGRSMREAHRGMGITGAQFDALAEDLVKTLDTFHVPDAEKGELLGAVAPLKKEIVEIE